MATAPEQDETQMPGTHQASLNARSEPQVVETAREGRRLVCPDCGQRIGASRGGQQLPNGTRIHGWACDDCKNVFPATTGGPEAKTWNDRICGIEVEFRDGVTRWVAALAHKLEREDPA